jgi:hypothetical protein
MDRAAEGMAEKLWSRGSKASFFSWFCAIDILERGEGLHGFGSEGCHAQSHVKGRWDDFRVVGHSLPNFLLSRALCFLFLLERGRGYPFSTWVAIAKGGREALKQSHWRFCLGIT